MKVWDDETRDACWGADSGGESKEVVDVTVDVDEGG